jgi:hypothetical protein
MLDEYMRETAGERRAQVEADMAFDFSRSVEFGDPDATPAWAGTVTDYRKAREMGMAYSDERAPRRSCTVAESLQDALDYTDGPSLSDVVKLISLAMKSDDKAVSVAARALVHRAALKFAEHNAEVE